MATAKLPTDDDISYDLKALEDLQINQKDLTSKQLTAIMDSMPNLSLESTRGKSPKPLSQIDELINAIKLLDEREKRLGKSLLPLPSLIKYGANSADNGWTS